MNSNNRNWTITNHVRLVRFSVSENLIDLSEQIICKEIMMEGFFDTCLHVFYKGRRQYGREQTDVLQISVRLLHHLQWNVPDTCQSKTWTRLDFQSPSLLIIGLSVLLFLIVYSSICYQHKLKSLNESCIFFLHSIQDFHLQVFDLIISVCLFFISPYCLTHPCCFCLTKAIRHSVKMMKKTRKKKPWHGKILDLWKVRTAII